MRLTQPRMAVMKSSRQVSEMNFDGCRKHLNYIIIAYIGTPFLCAVPLWTFIAPLRRAQGGYYSLLFIGWATEAQWDDLSTRDHIADLGVGAPLLQICWPLSSQVFPLKPIRRWAANANRQKGKICRNWNLGSFSRTVEDKSIQINEPFNWNSPPPTFSLSLSLSLSVSHTHTHTHRIYLGTLTHH